MFNVCTYCAQYRTDKTVEKRGSSAVAICPLCQHPHPFIYAPLMILCGASGTGKTTTLHELPALLRDDVVTLEADILLMGQPIQEFAEMWLRVCKNVAQSGRPVLLGASGFIPPNVEDCIERRYFSHVHYLAFTCEPDEQAARLNARPAWRGTEWSDQLNYNRWIREESGLELLDTTHISVAESAEKVRAWVKRCLDTK